MSHSGVSNRGRWAAFATYKELRSYVADARAVAGDAQCGGRGQARWSRVRSHSIARLTSGH
jgi:hypothetical protein